MCLVGTGSPRGDQSLRGENVHDSSGMKGTQYVGYEGVTRVARLRTQGQSLVRCPQQKQVFKRPVRRIEVIKNTAGNKAACYVGYD